MTLPTDNSYRFYITNSWSGKRNIDVRKYGVPIKDWNNRTVRYSESATVAQNISCDCKGLRGSGKLVMDNACEKHQVLMTSVVLSSPSMEDINTRWNTYYTSQNSLAASVRSLIADLERTCYRGRYNNSTELDINTLHTPTLESEIAKMVEKLQQQQT